MRNYYLAEDVRACLTPTGAIFLNLKLDSYSGIDASQARALSAAVEGWPESPPSAPELLPDTDALIASLCAEGVLVPCVEHGRPYSPPQHNEPTDELIAWRFMTPMKVRLRDVLSFLRALVTAILMLRCRPLSAVAKRAQRLPTHTTQSAQSAHSADTAGTADAAVAIDLVRARELLTLYTYIRMFVFARRGRCLLDSLTLLEFLAAHGVRSQWIIGVRVRPFAAHSWLQHQHWVLNGTPAFVRGFRAIFTT